MFLLIVRQQLFKKMFKQIVVLHHNDNDGCCAAWVVKHFYSLNEPEAEVITVPVQYGKPVPYEYLDKDVILYIVDFSYRRSILLNIKDRVKEIHVFDHHATAEEDLTGLPFALFSKDKAGAGMTWEILFPNEEPPYFVKLVDDYDLWKFTFDDTEAFNTIAVLNDVKNIHFWRDLYEQPLYLDTIIKQGHEKLKIDKIEYDIIATSNKVKFGKYTTPGKDYRVAIYQTTHNYSKVGSRLLELNPDIDFTICWYVVPKDEKIYFKVRSADNREVHLGKDICEPLGGGGHKNSAGFFLPIRNGFNFVEMLYND